jgi:hypothetical protein
MGWIYRRKWQRRVALKKRLIQAAIDALVAREVRKLLGHVNPPPKDDGKLL